MKRSPFGAGLKGVTAMELEIYRYDMENAYSAGKGTKRADMILSAARYIMKDDRRYETMNRSDILSQAEFRIQNLLEDLADNDRILSMLEWIGARLFSDLSKNYAGFDADRARSVFDMKMQGLSAVYSDAVITDSYGWSLAEVRKMVSKCVKKEDCPRVVRELEAHFREMPRKGAKTISLEDIRNEQIFSRLSGLDREWFRWYYIYYDCVKRLGQELNDESNEMYWELYNMALTPRSGSVRLGCYDPAMNRVILYLYPIAEKAKKDKVSFETVLGEVWAHELFHACHCFWMEASAGGKAWTRTNISRRWMDTMKEGLADYFAYTWCRMEKTREHPQNNGYRRSYDYDFSKTAANLAKSWTDTKFPGWPYAGAKVYLAADIFEGRDSGNPWQADDSPSFAVLYETLKPARSSWKDACEKFLDIWKQYRRRWMGRMTLVKTGWPLDNRNQLDLYVQNDENCSIYDYFIFHKDGSLELVSEVVDKTGDYVDSERHTILEAPEVVRLYKLIAVSPDQPIREALENRFKSRDGSSDFEPFCERNGIPVKIMTI